MRKINLIICICFIVTLNAETMAQQKNKNVASVNTLEEKVYGLSILWSELKYNFVNIDRLNFNVDSLYIETIKKVLSTNNDIEYYNELEKFLARFDDAHTELFDRPEFGEEEFDYPKYATKWINDKFYFTAYGIFDDADSRLLGAEIIEIEGMPAMDYAEKYVMPKISSSTLKYKKVLAGTFLLNGKVNTYIKGKALLLNGEIVDFNIIRNGETIRSSEDKYLPRVINKRNNEKVYCEWKDSVAIMTINSFYPETVSNDIDSVMNEIKLNDPSGLIIDLRNNGGGVTDVALRLQMHITNADTIRSFGAQTRTNLGYGRAQGNYMKEYEDYYYYKSYKSYPIEIIERDKNIKPVQCPIIILIGPYSFSACEDFLINIYELPNRPLLIGEETAGSTGAPLVISLPHEALARICTIRALYPYSMQPFVGHGIIPDIEVEKNINDYLDGKDVVMLKALQIINNNY